MKDRTVFVIAHRLSTVQNADKIVVINDGEIAKTIKEVAKNTGIVVHDIDAKMTSEDFGEYLNCTKGCLFRFGIYDKEAATGNALHTCNFKIHEPAMKSALTTFCEYIMNANSK